MNKKVTPEILAEAKGIGRKAYENNEGLVPAQNAELMDLIARLNLEIGEGAVKIMKAFSDEIYWLADADFNKSFKW